MIANDITTYAQSQAPIPERVSWARWVCFRAERGRSPSAARRLAEANWKRALTSRQTTRCEPGRFAVQFNATSRQAGQSGDENASNPPAKHAKHTKRICVHPRASAVKNPFTDPIDGLVQRSWCGIPKSISPKRVPSTATTTMTSALLLRAITTQRRRPRSAFIATVTRWRRSLKRV